ncbi:hypothetical protein EQV97_22345 [Pseudomonas sp. TMW22090]|nr:hypothetical protein [Pseudomonas sp. TMW22090]
MIINLSPQRRDDTLVAFKTGNKLNLNYEEFDFSKLGEGDTLPSNAIGSNWFFGNVERRAGELELTLLLPNPVNYSPAQAFPVPLVNVPDGQVVFPRPLPDENGVYEELVKFNPVHPARLGVIDWSQVVTKAMKEAAASAAVLLAAKESLVQRNTDAALRITRINDRIETLSYGIEAGEASEEDEAEQALLQLSLKAWKGYKFALGKVTIQATWPASPVWPLEPAMPDIPADPEAMASETQ